MEEQNETSNESDTQNSQQIDSTQNTNPEPTVDEYRAQIAALQQQMEVMKSNLAEKSVKVQSADSIAKQNAALRKQNAGLHDLFKSNRNGGNHEPATEMLIKQSIMFKAKHLLYLNKTDEKVVDILIKHNGYLESLTKPADVNHDDSNTLENRKKELKSVVYRDQKRVQALEKNFTEDKKISDNKVNQVLSMFHKALLDYRTKGGRDMAERERAAEAVENSKRSEQVNFVL